MSTTAALKLQSRAGFTLAEVAVSATVMLFVITGTLTAITSGMQMISTSRHLSVATDLLTHQVNTTRMEPWATLAAYPAERTLAIPARFGEVARDMTLQRSVTQESADLRRITFTVTWNNVLGQPISRSEQVLIARNGLNASYGL